MELYRISSDNVAVIGLGEGRLATTLLEKKMKS